MIAFYEVAKTPELEAYFTACRKRAEKTTDVFIFLAMYIMSPKPEVLGYEGNDILVIDVKPAFGEFIIGPVSLLAFRLGLIKSKHKGIVKRINNNEMLSELFWYKEKYDIRQVVP